MNPRLADRPLDPKRRVPVPFAQVIMPDGLADFTQLSAERTMECGRDGRCGLCGQSLTGAMVAFIGGPRSAVSRTYSDPPMHVECAEDAFTLCPHLARPLVTRRDSEGFTPDGFTDAKPKRFVMLITDGFKMEMRRVTDANGTVGVAPGFTANAPEQLRVWRYVDGLAVEVGANR